VAIEVDLATAFVQLTDNGFRGFLYDLFRRGKECKVLASDKESPKIYLFIYYFI
jgi:hypothetical protein